MSVIDTIILQSYMIVLYTMSMKVYYGYDRFLCMEIKKKKIKYIILFLKQISIQKLKFYSIFSNSFVRVTPSSLLYFYIFVTRIRSTLMGTHI